MMTRPLRRAAAVAAVGAAGVLAAAGGPAAAQSNCYPPTAGCAPTTGGVTADTKVVTNTKVVRVGGGGDAGGDRLARTGAMVVPTALVGVGLVAAGVVMKRSSRRDKTSTTG